jgi:peptidylprolyl isomerase
MLPFLLALAQVAAPAALAPSEIVAAAPADAWVKISADDLLLMELAPDAAGKPQRVVIQLIPPPFSQGWVANIRALARAHWWDGTSVNRVQDNYVVQWGDATEKKPLPAGLNKVAESEYVSRLNEVQVKAWADQQAAFIEARLANATQDKRDDAPITDSYTRFAGYLGGFPAGFEYELDAKGPTLTAGPAHCYATVGVGRNLSPDTGTGAELYAVIGHAPRHLDRNIAVVGRVVDGIEHLSALPRGTEALGFYKAAVERVPIRSVRLASELPAAERPTFQVLSTTSRSFARYADARANRRDAFFIRPAGGADVCNVPVPIRRAP